MSEKVNPAVGIAVAVVAVLIIAFIGIKVFRGSGNDGGSEGKAVNIRPSNPNDPKYTEHLPKGIAGGGMGGKQ